MPMYDVIDQFRRAIQEAGLVAPGQIDASGTLSRFSSSGKPGDRAGWYVLHSGEIPAGKFGCWRSGFSQKWRAQLPPSKYHQSAAAERMPCSRKVWQDERERRFVRAR